MPLSPPTCPCSTVQNRKPFQPADEQRLSLLISGRQMPERPHLQSGSPSLGLLWEVKWSPYTHPPTKHLTLAAKGSAMRHQITPPPAHRRSGLHLHLFAPFQTEFFVLAAKSKMDSRSILLPKCWSTWQPVGLGTQGP